MSTRDELAQELTGLAIRGGAWRLVLGVGGEVWTVPVVEGRVGPVSAHGILSDVEGTAPGSPDEELALLAGLEGVSIELHSAVGLEGEMRWMPVSQVVRSICGDAIMGDAAGAGEVGPSVREPSLADEFDALAALTGALSSAPTVSEALDAVVASLASVYPSAVMLHCDRRAGNQWYGPAGALTGSVDRLETAVTERVVQIVPATGAAHEELFSAADRVALVPLGGDVVVALAWGSRALAPYPRMAQVASQLFRWACAKPLPDEREYLL
jgi:hypothetical protein